MKQTSIFRTLLALALTGLMATACTDALDTPEGNNPQTPLPTGAIALSIDPNALKPAFGENKAATRAGTQVPTVPGAEANTNWQQGDELLMRLYLYPTTDGNPDCTVLAYLQYSIPNDGGSAGTWSLIADKGYVWYQKLNENDLTTTTLAEKPVLITDPATGQVIGIRPLVGSSSTTWAKASIALHYSPGAEWKSDGTFALKAGTKPGTLQWWSANQNDVSATNGGFAFSFMDGGTPIAFTTYSSRLRIYTGRPGDEVKMVATNYSPILDTQADHTYTTTTDAQGNAYFYGSFEKGNIATISLPQVQVPGQAATPVEVYNSPMEMLQPGLTTALDARFAIDAELTRTQVFDPDDASVAAPQSKVDNNISFQTATP